MILVITIILLLCLINLIQTINLIVLSINKDSTQERKNKIIKNSIILLVVIIAILFGLIYLGLSNKMIEIIREDNISTLITIGIFCISISIIGLICVIKKWNEGMIIIGLIWSMYLSIFGCKCIFNNLKYISQTSTELSKLSLLFCINKIISGLLLLISTVLSM